jgi:hypothetical protein
VQCRHMAPTALLGVSTLCLCAATADGQLLGRIQWRPSDAIISSKWSIGTETMDRNLTVYDRYSAYLPPLGAKRARLQCGWGRCDHGPGAPYNWGWLDEAVFGLAAMGIKPWLELSYGNSNYPGGGTNGPGAAVPDSTVALEAWAAWVAAVAHRYSNVTDEFELWNEPSLGPSNYLPYATLANVTCRALHQVREKAATPGWAPQIFYGTMSGGYSGAGPEFLDGTLPLLEQQLAGSGLSLQDCIASVTYHAYSVHPEDTHKKSKSGPACGAASQCSGVEALANTLHKYVPEAYVFQGECGAPSTWERGGAMAHPGFNWTEVRQAKWNLRSMMGDAATPLVKYSSVFSAIDVCYDAAPENIGNYGLLAASCRAIEGATCTSGEGNHTRTCLNKTVDHIKPAFTAAQSVMQLWDDDIVAITDAQFEFKCDRQPANPSPAPCPLDAHAQPPQVGMHCDLKNTTHLTMAPAADATECQSMCCADSQCNCFAYSSGGYNAGCWLQNSPAPLQKVANHNISGGKVALPRPAPSPARATEGFAPVGHAFRNRSAALEGQITHVVVWDASPGCDGATCDTVREEDRLTHCSITVTHGLEGGGRFQLTGAPPLNDGGSVQVVLMNGTVHGMAEGQVAFQPGRVEMDVTLYDAPLLIAKRDAILPIVPL